MITTTGGCGAVTRGECNISDDGALLCSDIRVAARFAGGEADRVTFTSGTTRERGALALRGFGNDCFCGCCNGGAGCDRTGTSVTVCVSVTTAVSSARVTDSSAITGKEVEVDSAVCCKDERGERIDKDMCDVSVVVDIRARSGDRTRSPIR